MTIMPTLNTALRLGVLVLEVGGEVAVVEVEVEEETKK